MRIFKYTDYFHDGNVYKIKQDKNKILFDIESDVIEVLDSTEDKKFLSSSTTLKGTLILSNIKSIFINGKIIENYIKMNYDDGEILDFYITEMKVTLLIEWKNFPPNYRSTTVEKIEIESEKIEWISFSDIL